MRCKKCLHYEVCVKLGKPSLYGINQEIGCSAYKDKTKWAENKFDECDYKACPCRAELITNADYIRSISDDELADFINREIGCCAPTGDCKKAYDDCKACWLYWLKQSAEEGKR